MKLRLELEENLMIKTATAETSRIEYSVMIDLEISGVRATLRCYCIPEHIRLPHQLGIQYQGGGV
jgi:hypothetical protein